MWQVNPCFLLQPSLFTYIKIALSGLGKTAKAKRFEYTEKLMNVIVQKY